MKVSAIQHKTNTQNGDRIYQPKGNEEDD